MVSDTERPMAAQARLVGRWPGARPAATAAAAAAPAAAAAAAVAVGRSVCGSRGGCVPRAPARSKEESK
eukprot:scaffold23546_cov63-Phaeocystis_antarctica.AAC.6